MDLKEYGLSSYTYSYAQTTRGHALTYSTSHPGEVWKMEDILETIRAEVEAREASNLSKGTTQHRHSSSKLPNSYATSLVTKEQLPRCVLLRGALFSILQCCQGGEGPTVSINSRRQVSYLLKNTASSKGL